MPFDPDHHSAPEVDGERSSPMVLGIDAATPPASVAIVCGGLPVAATTGPFGRHTDAWILPAIDGLLREVGREIDDLAAIAAGIGPGTFTGIRVAIATAQGLGRGASVPITGVSTLAALARASLEDESVLLLPTIDARRGQVYAALARRSGGAIELLREPWLATPEELIESLPALGSPLLLGTGIAADSRLEHLPRASVEDWPAATGIALLAATALELHNAEHLPPATPFYLRAPDAKVGRNPLADA